MAEYKSEEEVEVTWEYMKANAPKKLMEAMDIRKVLTCNCCSDKGLIRPSVYTNALRVRTFMCEDIFWCDKCHLWVESFKFAFANYLFTHGISFRNFNYKAKRGAETRAISTATKILFKNKITQEDFNLLTRILSHTMGGTNSREFKDRYPKSLSMLESRYGFIQYTGESLVDDEASIL